MSVELFLELDSLLITAVYAETFEIIMNYVALRCISELDEVYYSHVKSKLKEELEDREFKIAIENYEDEDVKGGLHWIDKILFSTVEIVNVAYDVIYFHVTPYFLFMIIPMWK